jgi:hypothetical protein
MNEENNITKVGSKIIELRGLQIILANDVAELYGTTTREIDKAVRNNPDKFPDMYLFSLQADEKQYVVENFHHLRNLKMIRIKTSSRPFPTKEGGNDKWLYSLLQGRVARSRRGEWLTPAGEYRVYIYP